MQQTLGSFKKRCLQEEARWKAASTLVRDHDKALGNDWNWQLPSCREEELNQRLQHLTMEVAAIKSALQPPADTQPQGSSASANRQPATQQRVAIDVVVTFENSASSSAVARRHSAGKARQDFAASEW